ncbi:MAG TPA: PPOX class F420-dependent oxidoreductase [Acidimicrobiales bacterium]|nr:PPOX class F420-dependent oxidoreductase [Acidimicrobiales bacterium]
MDEAAARSFLGERHQGVLVTLRGDGSPQSSNIAYAFDGEVARISVTADRAKTKNLSRDPRAILHVTGESFYQYVSASGTAELSPVSTDPGDATGRELLELHDAVAPEPHPDPDEFFQAMVDDQRLVVRFRPERFTGMV